jgi:RNA polymerase sigma factor (TIGR02999 family)
MGAADGITRLVERDNPLSTSELLPLVYDELRRLAAQKLASEKPGQTLDATALVHQAYVRLVGSNPEQPWNGSGHFFAAAAEAMRRILVENARRKRRFRHGGGRKRLDLDKAQPPDDNTDERILIVHEALEKLDLEEKEVAELVKLRFFAGLTIKQAADALGVSVRTANRHWAYAKAWLHQQLS